MVRQLYEIRIKNMKGHYVDYRYFPRYAYNGKIILETEETSFDCHGRDLSEAGLGLLAIPSLSPGKRISLKLSESLPYLFNFSEQPIKFPGEVKWCHKWLQTPDPMHAMGVKFIMQNCDWCQSQTNAKYFLPSGEEVYICPDCFSHLADLWDGQIKSAVYKHLLGNII